MTIDKAIFFVFIMNLVIIDSIINEHASLINYIHIRLTHDIYLHPFYSEIRTPKKLKKNINISMDIVIFRLTVVI